MELCLLQKRNYNFGVKNYSKKGVILYLVLLCFWSSSKLFQGTQRLGRFSLVFIPTPLTDGPSLSSFSFPSFSFLSSLFLYLSPLFFLFFFLLPLFFCSPVLQIVFCTATPWLIYYSSAVAPF